MPPSRLISTRLVQSVSMGFWFSYLHVPLSEQLSHNPECQMQAAFKRLKSRNLYPILNLSHLASKSSSSARLDLVLQSGQDLRCIIEAPWNDVQAARMNCRWAISTGPKLWKWSRDAKWGDLEGRLEKFKVMTHKEGHNRHRSTPQHSLWLLSKI